MYILKIMLGACIFLGHVDLLRGSSAQSQLSQYEFSLQTSYEARNEAQRAAIKSILPGITTLAGGMGIGAGLVCGCKNPHKAKSVYLQAAQMAQNAHAYAVGIANRTDETVSSIGCDPSAVVNRTAEVVGYAGDIALEKAFNNGSDTANDVVNHASDMTKRASILAVKAVESVDHMVKPKIRRAAGFIPDLIAIGGFAMAASLSPENACSEERNIFSGNFSLIQKRNFIAKLQKRVEKLPVADPIRENMKNNPVYKGFIKAENDDEFMQFENVVSGVCSSYDLLPLYCDLEIQKKDFLDLVDSIHQKECAEHRSSQIVGAGLFGIGLANTDPEERRNVAAIGVCAGLGGSAFQSLWRSFSALKNDNTESAKRNFKGFVWRSLGAGSAACVHSTVTPHVIRGAAEGLIRTFYAVDEACFWSTQHPRASAGIAATAVAWKFRGPIGRGFSWLGNQVTMSGENFRSFQDEHGRRFVIRDL